MSPSHRAAGRLAAAIALLALASASPLVASARAEIAVVTELGSAGADTIVSLVRAAAGGHEVRLFDTRRLPSSADPIARGRMLAQIASADLVVPIGAAATRIVALEIENARAFFVGGGLLPGEYLDQSGVAGILPYNHDEVVRVIKRLRPGIKAVGFAVTAGYAGVFADAKSAVLRAGLEVVEKRAERRRDVGPAVRFLVANSDVIWLLGDPMVSDGAGFRFVVETALANRIPVVGTTRRQVDEGALFYMEPDPDEMAVMAGRMTGEIVSSKFRFPAKRIVTGPPGGIARYHGPLAERLGVAFAGAIPSERLR